jgi:hypothetical protein
MWICSVLIMSFNLHWQGNDYPGYEITKIPSITSISLDDLHSLLVQDFGQLVDKTSDTKCPTLQMMTPNGVKGVIMAFQRFIDNADKEWDWEVHEKRELIKLTCENLAEYIHQKVGEVSDSTCAL